MLVPVLIVFAALYLLPAYASASTLTGKTLPRIDSPRSVYDQPKMNSAQPPLPRSTPFNATHVIKCELVNNNSTCGAVKKEINFTLQRSTWWHCGSKRNCGARFNQDLLTNMFSADCTSGRCFNHSIPAYIGSLRGAAIKLYRIESTNGSTTKECGKDSSDVIELMENVIMQKARFCRFDLDMYAKMISLLNQQAKCGGGVKMGATAGNNRQFVTNSYSYTQQQQQQQQQQPVYQQVSSTLLQNQQQQSSQQQSQQQFQSF